MVNMGNGVCILEMSQVMGLLMLQDVCTLFGKISFKMSTTASCFSPNPIMCVCACAHVDVEGRRYFFIHYCTHRVKKWISP